MQSPVPSARLDLTHLSPMNRLESWRLANPSHEVTAPETMSQDTGSCGATVWHLGPVLMSATRVGSLRLTRDPGLIRRDHFDHISIVLCQGGRRRMSGADARLDSGPGSVSVVDLAQPGEMEFIEHSALKLLIPRDSLAGLDVAAAHCSVLGGGAAELFVDYLGVLQRHMPNLRADELPGIARITVDLFAAALRPTIAAVHRARPAIDMTLLQRARRYVEEHLHDPGLTPDAIAAGLKISRARLYTLLTPLGGVSAYVRTRRLERADTLLRAACVLTPIKVIAYQVGFTSEAHFSRVFRQHFGCSPREARGGEPAARLGRPNPDAASTWREWLHTLRY